MVIDEHDPFYPVTKDKRQENEKYLKFVRSLPCSHCQNPSSEPHHIINVGMGTMGSKASDIHTMPLCRSCHDAVHGNPDHYPQIRWMIRTQNKAIMDGIL